MSRIKPADHVEDDMALRRRHAGGGLVEQQQLRPLRQGDRDLDQTLAAIGQFAHLLQGVVGESQRFQMIERLVDDRAFGAGPAPEMIAGAGALADGQIEILQHGQAAEQLIDLKGAGDAAADARGLLDARDVLAVEPDACRTSAE